MIAAKAKDFLQNLIREHDTPPKPMLVLDMSEFRPMQNLIVKAQEEAKEINIPYFFLKLFYRHINIKVFQYLPHICYIYFIIILQAVSRMFTQIIIMGDIVVFKSL